MPSDRDVLRRVRPWVEANPRRAALLLIGAGTLVRLVLALTTDNGNFDLSSLRIVRDRLLQDDVTHLYTDVNSSHRFLRWPYPPGYFPVLLGVHGLVKLGMSFVAAVRLPVVAADAAIAWLVFVHLRTRANAWVATGACGLVAFGPAFALVAGVHGQIDSVAIVFAVAAVVVWERGGPRRALWAGLLFGVGATVKTVPGLLALGLAASARSWREGARLVAVAAAIPVLALLPFALADLDGVRSALTYRGLPGTGGLSLFVQPSFAGGWLRGDALQVSALSERLQDGGGPLVLVAMVVTLLLVRRRRLDGPDAVAATAIGLWLLGVNFFPTYLVWGLPFLLLAGRLRTVLVLQALFLLPSLISYTAADVRGWNGAVIYGVYVPLVVAGFVAFAVVYRRLMRAEAAPA